MRWKITGSSRLCQYPEMKTFHLYVDDTGPREPNHVPPAPRRDGMDCFALGGVLIDEADIGDVLQAHSAFMDRWQLSAPLHSTKIRGRRDCYNWLGKDRKREDEFLTDLSRTMLSLPIMGLACVIDRPGYASRYAGRHEQPWFLCKTAFAILVERGAKY